MKLIDLLNDIAIIDGEEAYVELVAQKVLEVKNIYFTYGGRLHTVDSLIRCLPDFVLETEVLECRTPLGGYKFGLNSRNRIVECKKEIYIEY